MVFCTSQQGTEGRETILTIVRRTSMTFLEKHSGSTSIIPPAVISDISSPSTNPFFGSVPGRDEIFAYGLRNPWRFSFDRSTGQLYVGDVGQNQIEEIDLISAGGNYGWRILEGTRCTGLGPASCTTPGFIAPIAEYSHSSVRCSVTGGYVYRGSQ